jgi:hypothetical protein
VPSSPMRPGGSGGAGPPGSPAGAGGAGGSSRERRRGRGGRGVAGAVDMTRSAGDISSGKYRAHGGLNRGPLRIQRVAYLRWGCLSVCTS